MATSREEEVTELLRCSHALLDVWDLQIDEGTPPGIANAAIEERDDLVEKMAIFLQNGEVMCYYCHHWVLYRYCDKVGLSPNGKIMYWCGCQEDSEAEHA